METTELLQNLHHMLPYLVSWGDEISYERFSSALLHGCECDCWHDNCCFPEAQAAFQVMKDHAQHYMSHFLDSQEKFLRFLNLLCLTCPGTWSTELTDSEQSETEETLPEHQT